MAWLTTERQLLAVGLIGLWCLAGAASAGDKLGTSGASGAENAHMNVPIPDNPDVKRSVTDYAIPNVSLVREDGKRVNLAAELDDGRPVVINFVYTSCSTICPMSSQVFEQLQEDLGSARATVHLVSVSIDAEQDTPSRLRAYAAQFHAAKGWNHYSGSIAASIAVQKAFDAYRGDKMSHLPLTLMRAAPGQPWIRFDGFARAEDLMAERERWTQLAAAVVAN